MVGDMYLFFDFELSFCLLIFNFYILPSPGTHRNDGVKNQWRRR